VELTQTEAEATYADAMRQALREEMRRDATVVILGEDVGDRPNAGPRVTSGLQAEFGAERVIDMPVTQSALVGAGIGAALAGLRPVVSLAAADFLAGAFNPIVEVAAKMHWRTAGRLRVPLVIRCAAGGGTHEGPWRSQSPEGWFAHVPGLKIVMPATPYDARGLLKAAIRDDNPVLFLEPGYLYRRAHEPLPVEEYTLSLGQAEIRREGTDLTIISYGALVYHAADAAEALAPDGISAEVIDLRTLIPLDLATLAESVGRTHRALIVHEDTLTAGLGAEIAAQLSALCFADLRAPIQRVAAPDTPYPAAPVLEAAYLPDAARIAQAARAVVAFKS
jgi:2-oxoisovalerate dehydrogenase E1 component beta subunit